MNGYELSRIWFDWCFENPERIRPNHTALYFFCIEHCNRLGWKRKFGLPTTMAKEALGIKSYNTYHDTLMDLVEFGFVELIEKSKNQYSSNIIALSKFNKATDNALDKATIKHTSKQSESTHQSTSSIDKPLTNNKEQEYKPPVVPTLSIDYKKFIDGFNSFAHRKFKMTNNVKSALNNRLKDYSKSEIMIAIEKAHKDRYHIETNFKYLTPEFILRPDKLEKFLNNPEDQKQMYNPAHPQLTN